MDIKDVKLEKGMYVEAAAKGVSFVQFLEDFCREKEAEVDEIYKGLSPGQIALKKAVLKTAGEKIPLTAFERKLKQYGIVLSGAHSSKIEKIFQTADSAVLFPEIVSNRVIASQMAVAIYERFLANRRVIRGLKARHLYLQDTEDERQLAQSTRSGEFPETRIKLAKEDISLKKYGRKFLFDYETLFDASVQELDSLVFARVGRQLGIDITNRMVYVLENGDGNSNGLEAGQTEETATTAVIVKGDIIKLATCLPIGYQINECISELTYLRAYWETLSDMTNPSAQKAEIGVPFPNVTWWTSSDLTDDLILGVDTRFALEFITNDTVMLSETDRLIDKQEVMTVISTRVNFKVLDQDAIGALDVEH